MSRSNSGRRSRRSRSASTAPAEPDRERGAGFAGLPWLLAAGLLALALLFLIVRVSVVNALLEVSPEMAAMVAPRDSSLALERVSDALRQGGEIDEATRNTSREAFERAPLAPEPLLLAARRALDEGDQARADRLIAMAHRRNPRSRYTLTLLLEQHLRQGRVDELAGVLAVLTRLQSEAGEVLMALLARMATEPQTSEAVRQVIQSDSALRVGVLEQLARQGADPDKILELAGADPRPGPDGETPRWQRLMLDGLVARGEVGSAYEAWTRLAGTQARAEPGLVYDRDFTALPGPPPFNWNFEQTSDGFAEISRSSPGLFAEYYARKPVSLGGQLLRLAPGRYSLGFQAEGEAEGEDGRLSWAISCHPSGRPIGEIAITGVDYTAKKISGSFTVPAAGCPAQWLRLVGKAAEFPKEQQVTIRSLRLEKAGAP
jgi:hypothetical protein